MTIVVSYISHGLIYSPTNSNLSKISSYNSDSRSTSSHNFGLSDRINIKEIYILTLENDDEVNKDVRLSVESNILNYWDINLGR